MSSTVAAQRQLVLHQRALEALRERIAREAYLSVREVAERLHLSREKVEALPMELLPYGDYGAAPSKPGKAPRSLRRYHPADVLAVDARLRAWRAAQARSEGEAYLRGLREELEARDAAAVGLARAASEAVA